MINVVFRRICGHNKERDVYLDSMFLSVVPDKGELINIGGEPYVVFERAWACGDKSSISCFVRLSPLQFGQDKL